MSREIDPKILKYVPKAKQEAISSAWHDEDGYWITLKDDWNADNMDVDCHTIHEDTIKELRYQISGINRREDPDTAHMVYMPGLELVREDFKTNLAYIRNVKRISQSKLAEVSGVNVRMIQYYEQGYKDINAASVLTVYRLAQALNCTVEDLIEK